LKLLTDTKHRAASLRYSRATCNSCCNKAYINTAIYVFIFVIYSSLETNVAYTVRSVDSVVHVFHV